MADRLDLVLREVGVPVRVTKSLSERLEELERAAGTVKSSLDVNFN